MASFREIIREKTFLDVAQRSREVGQGRIVAISQSDNIVQFSLDGLTDTYIEYIRIIALDNVATINYTLDQLTQMILNSNLEIACTCPAYLYWGFQYVDAVRNYGLWIASISPDIRNPNLKAGGCKHLHRILSDWEQYAGEIASLYPYKIDIQPILIKRRSNNSKIKDIQGKLRPNS